MKGDLIYLDNNATTPCDPKVVEAMLPYFHEIPGNAASRTHIFGWKAEEAVKQARANVAKILDAEPEEIVFTSGATEAVNLALKGVFEAYASKGRHIITCQTEHKAVLDTCEHLEKLGAEVTILEVDKKGLINLEELKNAIRKDTILVSIMWANNETGVIQDVEAIGEICKEKDVFFLCDATQAVGKIPVSVQKANIHLAACSAHKLYGPKGIGALYVRRKNPRVKVIAQIDGGGHEREMRSGTLNVPAIVGFGKAVEIALQTMEEQGKRLKKLRDTFEKKCQENIEEVTINGSTAHRLPHVTNLTFKFVESENLMASFNQRIAVSSGSACTSATLEPSYVLRAMGISDHDASASLRFSLGRWTTEEQMEETLQTIIENVAHLRSQSPVWQMFKEGIDVEELL
ncbi:MAG: IscS subfamily cysteine desulfurase [Saprospiraceae bacterium]